jgi:hypothetical protein
LTAAIVSAMSACCEGIVVVVAGDLLGGGDVRSGASGLGVVEPLRKSEQLFPLRLGRTFAWASSASYYERKSTSPAYKRKGCRKVTGKQPPTPTIRESRNAGDVAKPSASSSTFFPTAANSLF